MAESEIIRQYREYRRIVGEIQSDILDLLPYVALVEFGRRLGAVSHGEVTLDDPGDLKLLHDLAIHTGRHGRSRAIDRYAHKATFQPGSDYARVLHGLRTGYFTVFQVRRRHDTAGMVAYDIVQDRDFHFMDISIALTAPPKTTFVGRLMEIDGYSMSCITVLPIAPEFLESALQRMPGLGSRSEFELFQDLRCAIAFYRSAIEHGIMQRCVRIDVAKELPTKATIASMLALNGRPPVDLLELLDAR